MSPSSTAIATSRPFIGARIAASPSSAPGLGLCERIDQFNERLPPAGESVHAAIGLVERDLVAVLAALVLRNRIHVGALDEMHPHGDAIDGDVEGDAARTDELEGIGDPPRVERVEARRSALVAPLEQKPCGGVDSLPVRRMRLSPKAPEIGVDEAGVDRSGRELPTAQEPAQKGEIGLRPDDDGVVELLQERGQRLGAGRPMNDHLGDHRIVIGRDAVAGGEAGVDPDALPRP